MNLHVELDQIDGHEGPALRASWSVPGERNATNKPLAFDAQLSPADAFRASEALLDCLRASSALHVAVPTVIGSGPIAGAVVEVHAPREFWRALAGALEVGAARACAGSFLRCRIDCEPDDTVSRSAATVAGWQLEHRGA